MKVSSRFAPGDLRERPTSDLNTQTEGATSTKTDGLLQVIRELKVRRFYMKEGLGLRVRNLKGDRSTLGQVHVWMSIMCYTEFI